MCTLLYINFTPFLSSWALTFHHPPLPGRLYTAGKMRDFWGQMCFHYTTIMPLKILIALAVFFWASFEPLEDVAGMFWKATSNHHICFLTLFLAVSVECLKYRG
ncbi:hypothetical protein FKM82_002782 [Ascaphus truei]